MCPAVSRGRVLIIQGEMMSSEADPAPAMGRVTMNASIGLMIALPVGIAFWAAVAIFGFVDVVRPVALAVLVVGLVLRVTRRQ